MTIIMVVEKWRHYLEYKKKQFIIRTNHENLKYLPDQKKYIVLQKKRLTKLLGLNYKIHYRKVKKNIVVNVLSIILFIRDTIVEENHATEDKGSFMAITTIVSTWYRDIRNTYKDDPFIHEIIAAKLINIKVWLDYSLTKGILKYKGRIIIRVRGKVRFKFFNVVHESFIERRVVMPNTYRRVKPMFYWLAIRTTMKQFIEDCAV